MVELAAGEIIHDTLLPYRHSAPSVLETVEPSKHLRQAGLAGTTKDRMHHATAYIGIDQENPDATLREGEGQIDHRGRLAIPG